MASSPARRRCPPRRSRRGRVWAPDALDTSSEGVRVHSLADVAAANALSSQLRDCVEDGATSDTIHKVLSTLEPSRHKVLTPDLSTTMLDAVQLLHSRQTRVTSPDAVLCTMDLSPLLRFVRDALIDAGGDTDELRNQLVMMSVLALEICRPDNALAAFQALQKALFERAVCIQGNTRSRLERLLVSNVQMSFDAMARWCRPGEDVDSALSVQCWSLRCIVAAFSNGGGRAVDSDAAAMFETLLGVVPRFVTEAKLDSRYVQMLNWGLRALLAVITEAGDAVTSSITSLLWIIRRCMTYGTADRGGDIRSFGFAKASYLKPPSATLRGDGDRHIFEPFSSDCDVFDGRSNVEVLFEPIRLLCQQCLQAAARFGDSLFNPRWASLIPSNISAVASRNPFGGSSIMTILLHDPSERVRASTAAAVQTMIEFSAMEQALPLPSVSETPLALPARDGVAFTPSSRRNLNTVLSLHEGIAISLQACASGTMTASLRVFTVQVLKAASALLTKCPYAQLDRHVPIQTILAKLASPLHSLLRQLCLASANSASAGFAHEVFSCLGLLYAVQPPVDAVDKLYECALEVVPLLVKAGWKVRSAPNAVTVLTRLARSRSKCLAPNWSGLLGLINECFCMNASDSGSTQAILQLLEQWMTNSHESLLPCPGALDLFLSRIPALLEKKPHLPLPLRARAISCIYAVCSQAPLVVDVLLAQSFRSLILEVLQPNTSLGSVVAAAACRCLAVLSIHRLDAGSTAGKSFLSNSVSILLSKSETSSPLSVRQQSVWALAEVFSSESSEVALSVVSDYHALWRIAVGSVACHDKVAVSALRLCTALLASSDVELTDSCPFDALNAAVQSRARATTPVKIRWNAYRVVRELIVAKRPSSSLITTLASTVRHCNNEKVRSAAITSMTAGTCVADYGGEYAVCLLGCALFERAVKERHVLLGAQTKMVQQRRLALLKSMLHFLNLIQHIHDTIAAGCHRNAPPGVRGRDQRAWDSIITLLRQNHDTFVPSLQMWLDQIGDGDYRSEGIANREIRPALNAAILWLQGL